MTSVIVIISFYNKIHAQLSLWMCAVWMQRSHTESHSPVTLVGWHFHEDMSVAASIHHTNGRIIVFSAIRDLLGAPCSLTIPSSLPSHMLNLVPL